MFMIYTSKRGKQIVFDDYSDSSLNDTGTYWAEMCPHCHNKYRGILGNRCDEGGTACGTCSVSGCENDADYYVDFDKDEVSFISEISELPDAGKGEGL